MAKYKLNNLSVKTVAEGTRKGTKYVEAIAFNMKCVYVAPQKVVYFHPEIVKMIEEALTAVNGDSTKLPQTMTEIEGQFYTVPTKPYTRVYSEGLVRKDGTPIQAGTPVMDPLTGQVKVYTSVKVFAQYFTDDDGTKQYVGDAPESIATRYVETFGKPVKISEESAENSEIFSVTNSALPDLPPGWEYDENGLPRRKA